MIKHLRTDSRMVHGKITTSWMDYVGAKEIVVCNDEASKDKVMLLGLPMAARGAEVKILSVRQAVKYIKANEEKDLFVICRTPSDALSLLKAGLMPEEFNVGTNSAAGTSKMVTNYLSCDEKEAKIYAKIADYFDGKISTRLLPTDAPQDLMDLLKKYGLL